MIAIVVVLVVVALVVPILLLAHSIGERGHGDQRLADRVGAQHRRAAELNTTIEHAEVIVAGLNRGRTRLGG